MLRKNMLKVSLKKLVVTQLKHENLLKMLYFQKILFCPMRLLLAMGQLRVSQKMSIMPCWSTLQLLGLDFLAPQQLLMFPLRLLWGLLLMYTMYLRGVTRDEIRKIIFERKSTSDGSDYINLLVLKTAFPIISKY